MRCKPRSISLISESAFLYSFRGAHKGFRGGLRKLKKVKEAERL